MKDTFAGRGDWPGEDKAMAALRAADPAANQLVDLSALRTAVDARLGGALPAAEPEPAGVITEYERLPQRQWYRRPQAWTAVAAVTAVALAIGAGGFWAGQRTADQADDRGRLVFGPAAGPALAAIENEPQLDAASGAVAADSIGAGYGSARVVLHDGGLSTERSTGQVWAIDASAAFTAQRAAELAAAFGVSGEPALVDDGWTIRWWVGPEDGSAASVWVDSAGAMGYQSAWLNTDDSVSIEPMPAEGAVEGAASDEAVETAEALAEPSMAVEPSTETVTDPEAEARLRALIDQFSSADVAWNFSSESYSDGGAGWASANAALGGSDGALNWWIEVSGGEITYASGVIGTPVSLGDYEVISPAEAVTRANDPRFSGSSSYYGTVDDSQLARTGTSGEVAAPAQGAAIAWPVADVTIVRAELVATTLYSSDGSFSVVPTYSLFDAYGNVYQIIALADAHLDFQVG